MVSSAPMHRWAMYICVAESHERGLVPAFLFRCKKGSRVYAMYPHTTSLYSATVIDNTTYCRQDDDIIVVEFDGDEPGKTVCMVLPRSISVNISSHRFD